MDKIIVSIYDSGIGGADIWSRSDHPYFKKFCAGYLRADRSVEDRIINAVARGDESEFLKCFDSLVGLSDRDVEAIICEDGGILVYTRINKKWTKEVVR